MEGPKIYGSIHKLPLSVFIEVAVEHNLRLLIIEGEPTELELLEAWSEITDQYNDAVGGDNNWFLKQEIAKLRKLQCEYNQIQILIDVLRKFYVKAFADKLCSLLPKKGLELNPADREQYLSNLDRFFSRSKAIKLNIDITTDSIEAITNDKDQSTQPKREDFIKTLLTLSDHAGRDLDENTITVFAYCERLKRFNKQVNLNNNRKNKNQWAQ